METNYYDMLSASLINLSNDLLGQGFVGLHSMTIYVDSETFGRLLRDLPTPQYDMHYVSVARRFMIAGHLVQEI